MNRLAKEKSPYLQQHRTNPVDWYPWSEEAFSKASRDDKPIFLSIGYSTCHWCHVMERESFENEEIAKLLNDSYVSIKVDREERPDIDQVYMSAVQVLTRSGGWPLSVFLTPDGKPFTGGTYFPPHDAWGRPGMKTLLPRLAKLWKENRRELIEAGDQITQLLQTDPDPVTESSLNEDLLHRVYEQLQGTFDSAEGGFGNAPKFPRSHDFSFLLRYGYRFGNQTALDMTALTLKKMAYGGIYDHLGGGFSRYSTDAKWRVPHFEKMLYDQAMTSKAYLEMFHITKDPFYAETARDVFRYVLNELRDEKGAFYSAEDADSEGVEGRFYVWKPDEIRSVLGADQGSLFCEFYGVTNEGNFEGRENVLNIQKTPKEFCDEKNMMVEDWDRILESSREKLFKHRSKRIRPHRDDKILTAWNGMMISSLAYGVRVLQDQTLLKAATDAASFIQDRLIVKGRLLRRYRDQDAAVQAFQDDYAYFALSLLDLFEVTHDWKWLDASYRLTQEMIRLFWDSKEGGFFYTAQDGENLIVRMKEYYDGAIPSGNSIGALLLLKLSRILEKPEYEKMAEKVILFNMESLNRHPSGFTQLIIALDFALGPTTEVMVKGDRSDLQVQNLISKIHSTFRPRLTCGGIVDPKNSVPYDYLNNKNEKYLAAKNEFAVFVCHDQVCQEVSPTIQDVEDRLEKINSGF